MSAYPVKIPVTFAGTHGASLIAGMVNFWLYGMGLYFRRHASGDPLLPKATIMVLIALATLQTAFISSQLYQIFITDSGSPELLDKIPYTVLGRWLCSTLTSFIAQIFFCSRIWKVGKRLGNVARYTIIPTIMFALMQISAGLAQAAFIAESKYYSVLSLKTGLLMKTTAIQGAGASLCDILISTTLCYIFHFHRSGMRSKTDSIINKLTVYAIERAIATSLCAVLAVLLYYFCSGTYYFLIPQLANTHFYLISAVSMLTSREELREQADPSFHFSDLDSRTTKGGVSVVDSDLIPATISGVYQPEHGGTTAITRMI